jgi:myo-inositol 2-dehydrogenase / D-chiro-inositol 1-dehydrogenase
MSLKICTIGCGDHAFKVHGPSYKKYAEAYPDTEFTACCDLNPEAAERFQKTFGFKKYYTDMHKMLDVEKPDGVCIIVSEHSIGEISIAVMEKGYPVLLEKPPGCCLEEAKRMVDAAEKMGVINQVAFNRRYIPLIVKLKELIRLNGGNGIQSIFYEFYRKRRYEKTFETTAIHGIDAVKHIVGSDYKHIRFTYQELPELGDGVINIYLDCTFGNGTVARLNFNPCTGVVVERATVNAYDNTYIVHTPIWGGYDSPGRLEHVKGGQLAALHKGEDLVSSGDMFETNGFYNENVDFFENVRYGRKSCNDIKSGLQSVEIMQCITERREEYFE